MDDILKRRLEAQGMPAKVITHPRWGNVLAMVTISENHDHPVIRLITNAPVCEDGEMGLIDVEIALPDETPEEHLELMLGAMRQSVEKMDAEKLEALFNVGGFGKSLDEAWEASEKEG